MAVKHCFGMTELVKSKDPTTQLAMEADLEAIMCLLDKWDIHLRMRYIESARNPADYFTRYAEKGDWQLEPVVARRLVKRWISCTVDRFADAANAQLPRFNSGYPARGTEHIRRRNDFCVVAMIAPHLVVERYDSES